MIWNGQKHSVKDAPPDVFDAWICQYVEHIVNVDTSAWMTHDRWLIINAVLEADVLIIEDGVLVEKSEQEEKISVEVV